MIALSIDNFPPLMAVEPATPRCSPGHKSGLRAKIENNGPVWYSAVGYIDPDCVGKDIPDAHDLPAPFARYGNIIWPLPPSASLTNDRNSPDASGSGVTNSQPRCKLIVVFDDGFETIGRDCQRGLAPYEAAMNEFRVAGANVLSER